MIPLLAHHTDGIHSECCLRDRCESHFLVVHELLADTVPSLARTERRTSTMEARWPWHKSQYDQSSHFCEQKIIPITAASGHRIIRTCTRAVTATVILVLIGEG